MAVVAAIVVTALVMPKDFKIEKSIVINKDKAQVFDYLKMVKNGNQWNPWMQKGNHNAKDVQSFKGEDGTVGFVNSWSSENKEVGTGEQEITALVSNEKIEIALRLEKPFKAAHNVYFTTESAGENQTKVTWGMTGSTPFPANLMCFFKRAEAEKKFAEGLENLKVNLEK